MKRVMLKHTTDTWTKLRPGAKGTVMREDRYGIHVKWDSGSTLSLLTGIDRWEEIDEDNTVQDHGQADR